MHTRTCPICGAEIKYKSFKKLEYDEKHGNCCKRCNVTGYEGHLREPSDMDHKLQDGNIPEDEIITAEDKGILGCCYLEVDYDTLKKLVKHKESFEK